MDPLQLPIAPYRVYYRIKAIPDDTIDALYPSLYQVLYKDISDRLTHVFLLPYRAQHRLRSLTTNTGHIVGGAFMPAPPIYRPGKGIDGPLADKSAVCAINRHLRLVGVIC